MNPKAEVKTDPRRVLPSVDRLCRALEGAAPDLPDWARREAVRAVLGEVRQQLVRDGRVGPSPPQDDLVARAALRARELARPHPDRVINATGIVLHTNLGRAPLGDRAVRAVENAARHYGDLELDLASGNRGSRTAALEHKLRLLSDAGGALAVNNNAAAVMLVLAVLGTGRAAVVSRGELVEIGGSFRVPEIMASAGVRLIEVGTTNRTHLSDYAGAVGPDTAILLKVHRSNFAQQGFVAEVDLPELADLAREHDLPLVEDLGSGTLLDLRERGFPEEIWAPGRLARGADVVCFSGDKLLGGPQAGLILTREAELAERLKRHPLARALRLDKLTLAALDATLSAHLEGTAAAELPVLRQLLASPDELEARAVALAKRLDGCGGLRVRVQPDQGLAGGGSLPGHELASWVVVLETEAGSESLAARLRTGHPSVLARVRDDQVLLDVRTLLDGDEDGVAAALAEALR